MSLKRGSDCAGSLVCSARQHLVKQFEEMRKLMKQMGPMLKGGRLPRLPGLPYH